MAAIIRRIVPARLRPLGYLEGLTRRRTSCRVRTGPFAGMRYGTESIGSAYIPKLLGIYESELWPFIEQSCSKAVRLVVDIGAAEGYYAIGLARRIPTATVVAFEADVNGREALRHTVALNGVSSQVEILGKCEVTDLERALAADRCPLLICDVEGYEQTLLDPARVPSLLSATILVEVHDFIVPGVGALLYRRFKTTHTIQRVKQQRRQPGEFPWRTIVTALLPSSYLDLAVSEWRPVSMSWLWMEPRRR